MRYFLDPAINSPIAGESRLRVHFETAWRENLLQPRHFRDCGVYWWQPTIVQFFRFDADYLQRLRAHHRETEDHFADYFTVVLRMKLHASRFSTTDAEDIIQETLLRVLRNLGEIVHPERLGAYVCETCHNVELEWWREQKKSWLGENIENFDFPDPRNQPDDALRQAEILTAVAEVLGQVSGQDREILIAVFLHERDREDICREFNITREYLRVLVHRAIQNARKKKSTR